MSADNFVINSLSFTLNHDQTKVIKSLKHNGIVDIRSDENIEQYMDGVLNINMLEQIFKTSSFKPKNDLNKKYDLFKYKFKCFVKSLDLNISNYARISTIITTKKHKISLHEDSLTVKIELNISPMCETYNHFELSELLSDIQRKDEVSLALINEEIEYSFYLFSL